VGVESQLDIACQSPVVCTGDKQIKFQSKEGFLTDAPQSKRQRKGLYAEEFNFLSEGCAV
jgi:hypothetical protein